MPRKGHKMSKETRQKMYISSKKRWENPEYKKEMSIRMKKFWKDPEYRKKMENSEETREKKRIVNLGRKLSEEHKKKIRDRAKGRKDSEETREKKRIANLGRVFSKESREKISKSVSKSLKTKKSKLSLFQGYFYSRKNRKTFFFRSSYEFNALIKLEANSVVEFFEMEYFKISYFFEGINRIYMPDFWVVMASGKEYIIEVKAKWVLKNLQVRAKAKAAKEFCERNNMTYTFWTEKTLGERSKML